MEKTKVAILGLGSISQITHLPLLSKMDDVIITSVCDKDKAKTKSIAQKYNVNYFTTNIDEFLEKADADFIIISTPTYLHKEHSIKALEKGFNLLVEKPLARTAQEANEIVEAADKYKKNLMVGMNTRFRPDIMMQESFISSNELGEIYYIKTGFLKKRSTGEDWSVQKEYSGGGVVMDLGINIIDIVLWMLKFPKIKSVSAVNYYQTFKNVEDSSFIFLRFHNNITVSIELSWTLQREDDIFYCNVYGNDGSASVNPLKIYKKLKGTLVNITPVKIEKPENIFKSSYKYELKYAINNLAKQEHDTKLFCSGREAIERMRIIDAIYKSAKIGREIMFGND